MSTKQIKAKQTRKALTVKEKYDILQLLQGGQSQSSVSRELKITRQTVALVWKNRDDVLNKFKKNPAGLKKCRRIKFEKIDAALFDWFKLQRDKNVPLSGPILIEKSKDFALQFGEADFKGSCGWFEKWKKRHGIAFRVVSGESAAVDLQKVEKWKEDVWIPCSKSYAPNDIYNCDETGLFWRLLPDKTMAFKNELCSGGKLSKERITVLLCSNMTGTDKLTPLVIGKSKNPRAFKRLHSRSQLCVDYTANKNAWMTGALFTDWLINLDAKTGRENRKILLLMDNCSAHPANLALKNVKILFLPPNTTSVCQPLDQGIIHNFKTKYRGQLLRRIIRKLDCGEDPKIDVLDAIFFLKRAWDGVSQQCISRCFEKAGFKENVENNLTDDPDAEEVIPFDQFVERRGLSEENIGSVEDYLQADEELITTGSLADEEIVASVNTNFDECENDVQPDSDEEDEAVVPAKISTKEFLKSLDNVRDWVLKQNFPNYHHINNILSLEEEAVRCLDSSRRQSKMTEYFHAV